MSRARHQARSLALQALYRYELNPEPVHVLLAEFLSHRKAKHVDQAYFQDLVSGVMSHQEAIDLLLQKQSAKDLTDLEPVELALLRLACYELQHRLEIPFKVVINEACELTKEFGTVEGYRFVNGVLDKVAQEVRQIEIKGK